MGPTDRKTPQVNHTTVNVGGRHWLDVAGYADSEGASADVERPWAWRYRDYVIQSFNARYAV